MLSTFSRSVPSKVYEAWIFLIRFLVSCIILHLTSWNLIPYFLAQEPNRSVPFSHQQKVFISDSVSDEMSFMYRENHKGPRTVPSGTPDKTGAQSDFTPFTTTRWFLKHRKESIHFNVLPLLPQLNNWLLRSSWGGCIKCLFKIQYECVNLSSIVQDFSPIIYYRSQLSFTTGSFPECMLPIWQEFIFIKMSHDIWTYYVFE